MKCAIDFETFYSAEYSVRDLGSFQYCRDPRFHAYCVSFAREDGVRYCGDPRGFDWNLIIGNDVFMHNATFDEQVLLRLQRDGIAPVDLGISVHDTADMAAYFGSGRSLKDAAKNFLGHKLQKDTRDKMKGKSWDTIRDTPLGQELLRYAQQDADETLALGMLLLPKWPEVEQRASQIGREAGRRGLPLDLEYLECCHRHLVTLTHQYLQDIPWYPQEKPLSPGAMRAEARKNGMWFPASLDIRDPEATRWIEEFQDKYPWVRAIRDYRRANTLANRVSNLWNGREGARFPCELLYFGAGTTGRWSGGGVVLRRRWASGGEESGRKFNPQNMPRKPMYGVDLRYCLAAPPGQRFYIADYNQIECRLLLWRAGDTEMLDLIRKGTHPYIAYGIKNLGAPPGFSKAHELYPLAKALVLGAGYQAGGRAFKRVARTLAGLDVTEDRAVELIRQYREANPRIVQYWYRHQRFLEYSANHQDPTHEILLKSGRVLRYYNPRVAGVNDWGRPQIEVQYTMGTEPDKAYGGLLTENEIQATARDVLRDGWVALVDAGFDVLFTVHDEYVILGPADGTQEFSAKIREVLATSSPWAEGCPLTVDIAVAEHYEK